jgi:hypothetical protein
MVCSPGSIPLFVGAEGSPSGWVPMTDQGKDEKRSSKSPGNPSQGVLIPLGQALAQLILCPSASLKLLRLTMSPKVPLALYLWWHYIGS